MNFIVAKIPNLRNAQPQRAARRDAEAPARNEEVFTFDGRDVVKQYYTTENAAVAAAKQLAALNPQVQYGVFAAGRIFETATPTVLEKTYNVDGELSVKKES